MFQDKGQPVQNAKPGARCTECQEGWTRWGLEQVGLGVCGTGGWRLGVGDWEQVGQWPGVLWSWAEVEAGDWEQVGLEAYGTGTAARWGWGLH